VINVWRADRSFDVEITEEERTMRFSSWQSAVAKTLIN